ncbi:MAG: NTP transferase domain-containing protein [Bacilli bacterium]|nr:NTP transferase domain-containing protein [Bacilli bacterium]
MKDLTLVVMAAGMGSRFGGIKQLEPVGPSGEYIIDYSIYDAIEAGFNKVVIITRPELLDIFKETIGNRIEKKVKLEYALQEINKIPSDVVIPAGRTKMWGTTHAVLCAKDKINGDFAIINADDYYGKEAFKSLVDFFKNSNDTHEYVSINYPLCNTVTNNGKVKRGVCHIENDYITDLKECTVEVTDNKGVCEPLDGSDSFMIDANHPVMMNMFGFKHNYLDYLEEEFDKFIHSDLDLNKESLINTPLKNLLNKKEVKCKSIICLDEWMGMTYREDLILVQNKIKEYINSGKYKSNLWEA